MYRKFHDQYKLCMTSVKDVYFELSIYLVLCHQWKYSLPFHKVAQTPNCQGYKRKHWKPVSYLFYYFTIMCLIIKFQLLISQIFQSHFESMSSFYIIQIRKLIILKAMYPT